MHYLLKTEPSDYNIDDLARDRETVWDGVENAQALIFIRQIKTGDPCFIYHTGAEKKIVGLAEAATDAFADKANPKLAMFKLRFKENFSKPLSLAEIKSLKAFEGFDLIRLPRLSVMPVPEKFTGEILKRIQ
ncbi:MAG: EVE domain-containing protein [Rhizobacter sp.]|nr:EVE domain-containing protein [Chlorobiales bacterium]